jgi:hypothetical protein
VTKASAVARGITERSRQAIGDAKKYAELDAALKKEFGAVLRPEQMKRLIGVLCQQVESMPIGPAVLARDPELGKALELTDEQRQRLQEREAIAAVLTDAQKGKWKKLTGAPLRLARTGIPFPRRFAVPVVVNYLSQESVQSDLGLSARQKAAAQALLDKWEKTAPQTREAGAEAEKKLARLTTEFEDAGRALLDEAQRKRLTQIVLQQNFTNGREIAVFSHPQVVKGLGLSEKQAEQIKATHAERTRDLLALFTADEKASEVAKKVADHKKATYQRLHALLTPGQQAQLKDLLGEPFKGRILPGTRFPRRVLNTPIYLRLTGLAAFAGSEALHKELALTKDQVAKLRALQSKARDALVRSGPFPSPGDDAEKKRKALAESLDKELAGFLTAEQHKRFKQLLLQAYAGATLRSPATLARIVEVQQGLKLTDEQKKKLQNGLALDKVLDAGQQAKWKEMLGKRFEGNLLPTPGPSPFAPRTLLVVALQTKSVEEELRLTEKQKKRLAELEEVYGEKSREAAQNPNFQDFMKARQAALEELTQGVRTMLDAEQGKRLEEILVQHYHRTGLSALLLQPVAKTALGLDDKQLQRLRLLQTDYSQLTRLFSQEFFRGNRQGDEGVARTQKAMSASYEKKLAQLLTEEQKQKLEKLLARPFKGRIVAPRGGPGGFGAGGGFVGP